MSYSENQQVSLLRKKNLSHINFDLHRLEWSAHESQFVQRHPSQLKEHKSELIAWINRNRQQSNSSSQEVHLPWKPWLLCAMGKGLCCMASW